MVVLDTLVQGYGETLPRRPDASTARAGRPRSAAAVPRGDTMRQGEYPLRHQRQAGQSFDRLPGYFSRAVNDNVET